MRLFKSALLSLVMVFCGYGFAIAADIDLEAVDRRIQMLMERPEMVGMAVAIFEDGELILAEGYGVRRNGQDEYVDADTVFRWASLSKSVAANLTLQFVEDGTLTLQTPVSEYSPSLGLAESHADMTLEDVLGQRTGLVFNAHDLMIEDGKSANHAKSRLDEFDPVCAPGQCYSYQNVAFDSAREAIEGVTGLPYKTIAKQRIFEPLDMTSASLTHEGLLQSSNWARPHNRKGKPVEKVKPTYYRLPAAAGVNSSVLDLAKWMESQFSDDTPFSEFVLESTHLPRVTTPAEERRLQRHFPVLSNSRYGLGWRVYDFGESKLIGHRGAVEGYRSYVLFDPERKTGVAILWNSTHFRPVGLPLEIFDQVYDQPRRDWMRLEHSEHLPLRDLGLIGSGGR